MTAKEIIEASKHIPVYSYFPAMEIAKEFHDTRLVYVPGGDLFSWLLSDGRRNLARWLHGRSTGRTET